jgi:DNA-binding NarL/FixJ family response regulator
MQVNTRTPETDVTASAVLRVLVVARQPIVRMGLEGLLGQSDDLRVVGLATRVSEAEAQLASLRPEVAVAAWSTGELDDLIRLAEVSVEQAIPLVMVGELPTVGELNTLLRAGVRGFLLNEASGDEIVVALRAVAQGLLVLEPLVGRTLTMAAATIDRDETGPEVPLTDREQEVLQLLARGLPNKTIATRLKISEHTVKFHVGSILAKLEASSRTEAVTRAARRGLLAL